MREFKIGDFVARYRTVKENKKITDWTQIAYIGKVISEPERNNARVQKGFRLKILITLIPGYGEPTALVRPRMSRCKKITPEEVTFYMLQHGISNE